MCGAWPTELSLTAHPSVSDFCYLVYRYQHVDRGGVSGAVLQTSCRTQHDHCGLLRPHRHGEPRSGQQDQSQLHAAGVWWIGLFRYFLQWYSQMYNHSSIRNTNGPCHYWKVIIITIFIQMDRVFLPVFVYQTSLWYLHTSPTRLPNKSLIYMFMTWTSCWELAAAVMQEIGLLLCSSLPSWWQILQWQNIFMLKY